MRQASRPAAAAATQPAATDAGGVAAVPAVTADLFTGAAGLPIPLDVPPARAGTKPDIRPRYRSGDRSGLLGVGWRLEFGRIVRDEQHSTTFAPRYVYRTADGDIEIGENGKLKGQDEELTFARVGDHFEMRDAVGGTYEFGLTPQGRLLVGGEVVAFGLELYTDRYGNARSLHYDNSEGELEPVCIDYGGNASAAITPTAKVEFAYEARPDRVHTFAGGLERNVNRRLSSVASSTASRCGDATGMPYSYYQLTYSSSASTTRSVLASIRRLEAPSGAPLYAPVMFEYNSGARPRWLDVVGPMPPHHAGAIGDSCLVADFNGNGRTDTICETGVGTWVVGLSNFEHPQTASFLGPNVPIDQVSRDCFAADVNGDGKQDLVCEVGGGWSTGISTGSGLTTQAGFAISGVTHDNCLPADLNGDGTTDLACYQSGTLVWFSAHPDGWRAEGGLGVPVGMQAGEQSIRNSCFAGSLSLSPETGIACYIGGGKWATLSAKQDSFQVSDGPSPQTPIGQSCLAADLNGDGLTDLICSTGGGAWQVALGTGDGWRMENWAGGPDPVLPVAQSCAVIDLNGDGNQDVVCKLATGYQIALSTGTGWSTTSSPTGADLPSPLRQHCAFGDFRGLGITDMVCDDRVARSTGGNDVLTSFTNAIGGSVGLHYAAAADEWDAGTSKGLSLVQLLVVKSIDVRNGRGVTSTTVYHFDNGFFDPSSFQFRGFGTVVVDHPGWTTGSGIREEMHFLQGDSVSPADPVSGGEGLLRGRLFKTRIFKNDAGSASLVLEKELAYAADATLPGHPLQAMVIRRCEATPCRVTETHQYTRDRFGNLLAERSFNPEGTFDRTVVRTFVSRPDVGVVSLPLTETVFGSDLQTPIARTSFGYGETGVCQGGRRGSAPLSLTSVSYMLDAGRSVRLGFGYDGVGNLTCRTGARGAITRYRWDATETVLEAASVEATGAPTMSWRFDHFGFGNVAANWANYAKTSAIFGPNSGQAPMATYGFDAAGRPTSISLAASATTTYSYLQAGDPAQQRIRIESNAGTFVEDYFDGLGQVWSERKNGDASSVIAREFTYDERHLLTAATPPYLEGSTKAPAYSFAYDPVGRLVRTTRPDGTSSFRCPVDLEEVYGDARGVRTREVRDEQDQIVRIEELGDLQPDCSAPTAEPYSTTSLQYDAMGRVVHVVDGAARARSVTYNGLNEPTRVTDPYLGTLSATYDDSGSLLTRTDANGTAVAYSYDGLGRLRTERSGGKTLATFAWDGSANGIGRLASIANGSSATSYGYDLHGRVTSVISSTTSSPLHMAFLYDPLGRLARLTYPDGQPLDYRYSGRNLASISYGGQSVALFSGYDAFGRATRVDYGSRGALSRAFGSPTSPAGCTRFEQMCRTSISTSSGATLGRSFTYDASGNLVAMTALPGVGETYAYDALNRLVSRAAGGSTELFSYDRVGNFVSSPLGRFVYAASSYRPKSAGTLLISSDKAGRVASVSGPDDGSGTRSATFGYDALSRLTSVTTGGGRLGISYDGEDRIIATDGLFKSRRLGPGYTCVAASCTRRIFYNGTEVAEVNGAITASLTDQVGSRVAASTQAGLERYTYGAFGRREVPAQQPSTPTTGFAGQLLEPGVGLYLMGERWYSPLLGTFLTGDKTEMPSHNPQAYNRFSYALNRPTTLTDPTGREDEGGGPEGGDEGDGGDGEDSDGGNSGSADPGPSPDAGAGPAVDPGGWDTSQGYDVPVGTSVFSMSRDMDPAPAPTPAGSDQDSNVVEPHGPGDTPSAPGLPGAPNAETGSAAAGMGIESHISTAPATTMLQQVIPHVVAGSVSMLLGGIGVASLTVAEGALLLTPAGPVIAIIAGMQFAAGVTVVGLGVSEAVVALGSSGGHDLLEPAGTESAIAIFSGPGTLMGAATGAALAGEKGAAIGIGVGIAVQSFAGGALTRVGVGNLIDAYSLENFTRDSLDSSAAGRSPLP